MQAITYAKLHLRTLRPARVLSHFERDFMDCMEVRYALSMTLGASGRWKGSNVVRSFTSSSESEGPS